MEKKILLLDNYDSFTYNLLHIIRELGYTHTTVCRNDKITLAEVDQYDKIILSPGPGIPEEAGILLPLIREYAAQKSILGVCLGHQAIGESFGAQLYNTPDVFHGVHSMVTQLESDYIFDNMPKSFEAGRYHSWVINNNSLPPSLSVTARSEDGAIMAIRHNEFDVHGIQFHPESVLTPEGRNIIANFLKNEINS